MAESSAESTLPPPTPPMRSPIPSPGSGYPKRSPVLKHFLYNEQTGSQVEIGGGDPEEAGPSKKVCG